MGHWYLLMPFQSFIRWAFVFLAFLLVFFFLCFFSFWNVLNRLRESAACYSFQKVIEVKIKVWTQIKPESKIDLDVCFVCGFCSFFVTDRPIFCLLASISFLFHLFVRLFAWEFSSLSFTEILNLGSFNYILKTTIPFTCFSGEFCCSFCVFLLDFNVTDIIVAP